MLRISTAWIGSGLAMMAGLGWGIVALAQGPAEPWQGPAGPRPEVRQAPARPDQPVEPQYPLIQRRAAGPQQMLPGQGMQGQPAGPGDPGIALPPRAQLPVGSAAVPRQNPSPVPFILTPEEQQRLDEALAAWEKRNKEVKRFECKFDLLLYDAAFGTPNEPMFSDEGDLRYLAPDKGMYRIEGKRAEHWVCDGRSIFQYNFPSKKVVEYPLPPELQGKAISNGPLPFVFGNEAGRLKQRYFLRLITPRDRQGEVWLDVRPRFQRDAEDFQRAELILKGDSMVPTAIQLYLPGGKQRKVYILKNVVVNRRPMVFEPDPFRPSVPIGWKKELDPQAAAAAQASRGAPGPRR